MLARAVLAFLVLPGIVAFLIPAAYVGLTGRATITHPVLLVLPALGTAALLACARDFYLLGKGTLAPWAPPRHLIASGLYRSSRNPMYIAVVVILLGWAACFASWELLVYALIMAFAFHLRVVLGEEPWLARTHGSDWNDYARRVPRWFLPARRR